MSTWIQRTLLSTGFQYHFLETLAEPTKFSGILSPRTRCRNCT